MYLPSLNVGGGSSFPVSNVEIESTLHGCVLATAVISHINSIKFGKDEA
jgi:hypothetical protein